LGTLLPNVMYSSSSSKYLGFFSFICAILHLANVWSKNWWSWHAFSQWSVLILSWFNAHWLNPSFPASPRILSPYSHVSSVEPQALQFFVFWFVL
jgi:hypothetical protein